MSVSARNVFKGKITALVDGVVNAEVELTLPGGDRIVAIVAIVTEGSVSSLALSVGQKAIAYVKVFPDGCRRRDGVSSTSGCYDRSGR
ncbi:MAG: TOBE domain-containing protein [Candidatus Accumulibacter sp. UW26]|jgi:molybdate transport system regulatory protein